MSYKILKSDDKTLPVSMALLHMRVINVKGHWTEALCIVRRELNVSHLCTDSSLPCCSRTAKPTDTPSSPRIERNAPMACSRALLYRRQNQNTNESGQFCMFLYLRHFFAGFQVSFYLQRTCMKVYWCKWKLNDGLVCYSGVFTPHI